jgi:uncharacterized membrane protein
VTVLLHTNQESNERHTFHSRDACSAPASSSGQWSNPNTRYPVPHIGAEAAGEEPGAQSRRLGISQGLSTLAQGGMVEIARRARQDRRKAHKRQSRAIAYRAGIACLMCAEEFAHTVNGSGLEFRRLAPREYRDLCIWAE